MQCFTSERFLQNDHFLKIQAWAQEDTLLKDMAADDFLHGSFRLVGSKDTIALVAGSIARGLLITLHDLLAVPSGVDKQPFLVTSCPGPMALLKALYVELGHYRLGVALRADDDCGAMDLEKPVDAFCVKHFTKTIGATIIAKMNGKVALRLKELLLQVREQEKLVYSQRAS